MADILQKLKDSKKNLFVGLAGPGTGKSTAFKTIVDSTEYKGKKILILSFINKLVDELTNDFLDYENVTVSTLHSFAMKQVGDVDIEENLDKIISEDYLYINGDTVDFDARFQENNISEEEKEFYVKRKEYYKHEKKLYSMNSIVYAANARFERHDEKIPSGYDLILIDEFQDFNKLEYEFIVHLNKKGRVVVVGDENQSLYFFKKAEPQQIIDLYNESHTEEFSLDECFRCTEVIVDATNDLVNNAKKEGFLSKGLQKKFVYPRGKVEKKDKLSDEFPKIDFIPKIQGDLLIYKLAHDINKVIKEKGKKRILLLVPSYLKRSIHDGLVRKNLNVVEFELFSDEKNKNIKHRDIIETLKVLDKRKTDNLALRKILPFHIKAEEMAQLIVKGDQENKKIWLLLSDDQKKSVENDINLFKKAQKGALHLNQKELKRFSEIFALKNLLSKMIKGFAPVAKNAIEVEMTTVMSSKGLSAEYVYYIGIDDRNLLDKDTQKFTDHKICEFLVGITRAKEKLTLISMEDEKPKILNFLDSSRIHTLEN